MSNDNPNTFLKGYAMKEFLPNTGKQAVKKDACLPQAGRTLVLLNFKLELCKIV
jgi:hypothetical protein